MSGDMALHDKPQSPVKAYTLTIELWHTLNGERLIQTIDVSEGESFRVATIVNGAKWTTKGVVGQPEDDSIRIQFAREWYQSDEANLQSAETRTLNLNGEFTAMDGTIHGVFMRAAIQRNQNAGANASRPKD